jgi:hypothetical protein
LQNVMNAHLTQIPNVRLLSNQLADSSVLVPQSRRLPNIRPGGVHAPKDKGSQILDQRQTRTPQSTLVDPGANPLGTRPKGHIRTNAELIQDIGTRAELRKGGTGARAGTEKHVYSEKLLKRHQDLYGQRGLEMEKRWIDGETWEPGDPLKGSSRLDVRDGRTNTVYDYKFVQEPGQGMREAQAANIIKNVEEGANIVIVHPVKPTGL